MKHHSKLLSYCLLVVFLFTPAVYADDSLSSFHHPKLSRLVNMHTVKFHQRMLMDIARDNDNHRASGTPGYNAASDYVAFWLRISGYDVNIQEFEFPYFKELSTPEFRLASPLQEPYIANDPSGYYTMTYSASCDNLEAPIFAVDIMMPPGEEPNTSSSGCEEEDFADFPAGSVALIQRGSCSFYDKALNAEKAGAVAVIVFNEGQEGRQEAIRGTLGTADLTIPVIFTSHEIGKELHEKSQTQELRVRLTIETLFETRKTHNILAATPYGDPSKTLVVGAHLDSVEDGPGINDNGSGSALVLEAALKMGWWRIRPKHKIVFAFWAAEEVGLLGSEHYVSQLTDEEKANTALYLNFDMVASPNYVRFVYDGDGSDTGIAGPAGSGFIEEIFVDYFAQKGMPTDPTALDGRSDYAPFAEAGIPIGGLFTGAGGIKTEEQAAVYGGTAGVAYDANYHTPEDDLSNLNYEVEHQMLKAMAFTVDYFSTEIIPETVTAGQRTLSAVATQKADYRGPLAIR